MDLDKARKLAVDGDRKQYQETLGGNALPTRVI
jgi:hypothetical protein